MTPSTDKILHQFATLLPNLTLLSNFGGFHRTLQRVRLANRGLLLPRTPGSVPFGTCICSNVETILSWTCHVYGPFEFLTSLGTSILLVKRLLQVWDWIWTPLNCNPWDLNSTGCAQDFTDFSCWPLLWIMTLPVQCDITARILALDTGYSFPCFSLLSAYFSTWSRQEYPPNGN